MKLSFHALGKVPFINIKLKSLVKGSSNNGIPYLIISFETESNACRGISITSNLGKRFNKIIHARLLKFIGSNNLICENQIGFKENCRTADHIFSLKSSVDHYKAKIDLRKVLDFFVLTSNFQEEQNLLNTFNPFCNPSSDSDTNIISSAYNRDVTVDA
jgi:hypothetical protein